MKTKFFFAWYDFWVGFYFDRERKVLYICPLPCCVFMFYKPALPFDMTGHERVFIPGSSYNCETKQWKNES